MKLEITKEKVLEAAGKCDTARRTLQVLFPEAFKQEYPFNIGDVYVHPKDAYSEICLIRAHYDVDAYIFLGIVPYLVYSNSAYRKTMTKTEALAHLEENGMVFSHNIRDQIIDLISKSVP